MTATGRGARSGGGSEARRPGRKLVFEPLTPDRWGDLERLFGARGAYGGCWCMFWRITRKDFEQGQGAANRAAFRRLVRQGPEPGLLAYRDGEPIGWCAVGPRESFAALERSPVLRRVDERPVWSIVCFHVARGHRGQGVAEALVRAACRFAAERGARIVEAYPTVPRKGQLPPVSSYMGTPAMFERAGFVEVARPSAAKMVLRRPVRHRP